MLAEDLELKFTTNIKEKITYKFGTHFLVLKKDKEYFNLDLSEEQIVKLKEELQKTLTSLWKDITIKESK